MNNQAFELLKAFIRVIGITFFLNAIFELTHLPEEVVYLSQGGFVARTAVAATTTLFFICILNLVMAVIFCGVPPLLQDWLVKVCRPVHPGQALPHLAPNQPMKPTAPWQNNFSELATDPARGSSLSR